MIDTSNKSTGMKFDAIIIVNICLLNILSIVRTSLKMCKNNSSFHRNDVRIPRRMNNMIFFSSMPLLTITALNVYNLEYLFLSYNRNAGDSPLIRRK